MVCFNLSKIQTKRPNLKVFCQKDADGTTNSEDPDQSDVGLQYLLKPICLKTKGHYPLFSPFQYSFGDTFTKQVRFGTCTSKVTI